MAGVQRLLLILKITSIDAACFVTAVLSSLHFKFKLKFP